MLRLKACDVRDSREDMSAMRRSTLDTVAVINAAISGFLVNVELQYGQHHDRS